MDPEDLIYLTIGIIITICFILGIISIIVYAINYQSGVNCNLLQKNGINTKLEQFKLLFFNVYDCYVETENVYVPYDRFIGVRGKK